MNSEQASKVKMEAPSRLNNGEGQRVVMKQPNQKAIIAATRGSGDSTQTKDVRETWEARLVARASQRGREAAARAGIGEAHSSGEAGNDGGAKGPHFDVLVKQKRREGRLA